jgi:hypothetical protein
MEKIPQNMAGISSIPQVTGRFQEIDIPQYFFYQCQLPPWVESGCIWRSIQRQLGSSSCRQTLGITLRSDPLSKHNWMGDPDGLCQAPSAK